MYSSMAMRMEILEAALVFALLSISMAAPAMDNAKIVHKRFIVGHHRLEDVIAQSSCAAYMSHQPKGWVYAVRRECLAKAPTCTQVCANTNLQAQDSQTVNRTTWKCIGATHVYFDRPATGNGVTPMLGLKQLYYKYNSCVGGCGPNYCCCVIN